MQKIRRPKLKQTQQRLVKSINRFFGWIVLHKVKISIGTILTVVSIVVTFYPRPIVNASDPVDISNPFSSSFTITNNNIIPLREVSVSIGLGEFTIEPAQIDPNFIPSFNYRVARTEWANHSLDMDERFTVTINDLFNMQPPAIISGAKILVIVSYKPWFIPIQREKIFQFITYRQTNNHLYWYSIPWEPIKNQ